jgi:hypothetical protein
MDETMLKTTIAAALGLAVVWLVQVAPSAAQQAPIGHRQPSATDVPGNDSVRGDAGLAGDSGLAGRTAPASKKRGRSRRVQSNVDVIMKTPNICSNCNQ